MSLEKPYQAGLLSSYEGEESYVAHNRQERQLEALTAESSAGSVARPWVAGNDGDIQRDPVTGMAYIYTTGEGWSLLESQTRKAFVLYVDHTLGNDINAGDLTNPLQTIQEAFDRLPAYLLHSVTIDVATGNYPEPLFLHDKHARGTFTKLEILGKLALATLATGPNQNITAASGSDYTIVYNAGPAWTTDDLTGKFVICTAGTHAGRTAPISYNTTNTIYTDYTIGSPWDATDVFDIYESTVYLDGGSGFFEPTLRISSVDAAGTTLFTSEQFVQFKHLHLRGDPFLGMTIWIDPAPVSLNFLECYVQNSVIALPSIGRLNFECSCVDTLHGGGFLNNIQPNNVLDWQFVNCSVISTFRGQPTGKTILELVNTYWRSNSTLDGALFLRGSTDCYIVNTLIDGRSQTRRTVVIDEDFQGIISFRDSKILDSFDSGIGSRRIWNGVLRLEDSDISNSVNAGINAVGPIALDLTNYTSSVANGTFGVVLRSGAQLQSFGGNTATGGTNDLDLGIGSQIAWGALPHTNTTELTRGV